MILQKKSLKKFINENIETGSNLTTNGRKEYVGISKSGYQHKIGDKTKLLDGEKILPNAHRIASLLKMLLLGTHQVNVAEEHLSYYLGEYTFRYIRQKPNNRVLHF